jgi:sigma-B regulation protein RsbU (phosphoserine phosphatase)
VAELPVVFQYQQALDEFRREGREPPLLKRMSELISLLDLTTTLNSALSNEEILEAALLIVLGELQASRGALLVREEDGGFRVRAGRGLPAGAPQELASAAEVSRLGLELACPVDKRGRTIALIGLGPRTDGRAYSQAERAFLRSVAACAATPIENGLIYHELRELNRRLSVKVFQLHNLFDISRELTSSFEEETIRNLVTTALMGHLMVSRAAMYAASAAGLVLACERGLRSEEPALLPASAAAAIDGPVAVDALPESPLKDRLRAARLALVVPLRSAERNEGLLAVGERASGAPFSDEDRDFAMTLGRQAQAALESVRLHQLRVEKQRQDREMQIAREIQQSLFPSVRPSVPGFEVAAESRPCYQVGGDHYDFIPLPSGRLALGIADVSGKGAPASILMASIHASLRALAGSARPRDLAQRLNRFLYESTQPNKYVTLVYAELDPAARRLTYVNAGHVPPYLVSPQGGVSRLERGGPALGLIEDACYEEGRVELRPGELVAMVTDGVTEAESSRGEEFGDARVEATLSHAAGGGAREALQGLVEAVLEWAGSAGCSDDLTVLTLKAEGARA